MHKNFYLKNRNSLQGLVEVWLGKPGELRTEIEQLETLLETLLIGKIELVLHQGSSFGGCWIGEVDNCNPKSDYTPYNLTVFTSGTTGLPKPVSMNIRNRTRISQQQNRTWLLCYPPGRWSSISMLLHVLMNREKIIVPKSFLSNDLIFSLKNEKVNAISLTPSLFKSLTISNYEILKSIDLKWVTFGGEYATQTVLDLARELWPNAIISHIYASTEMGELFSESDGKEGFSTSKLNSKNARIAPDGELIVSDVGTNDYWKICQDRMYFIGRKSEIVNVGGFNVSLINVEKEIMKIDGIRDCLVSSESNALLGNLLVVQVVGNISKQDLRQKLAARIPKHEIPSQITFVDSISLNDSMKTNR